MTTRVILATGESPNRLTPEWTQVIHARINEIDPDEVIYRHAATGVDAEIAEAPHRDYCLQTAFYYPRSKGHSAHRVMVSRMVSALVAKHRKGATCSVEVFMDRDSPLPRWPSLIIERLQKITTDIPIHLIDMEGNVSTFTPAAVTAP